MEQVIKIYTCSIFFVKNIKSKAKVLDKLIKIL